ncbi:GtrA-like protein [Mycobacterium bohemicum DSM 44277]|uniref:Polysaccharide biosynthesis protein GtrA n=2 Tax=Mycobacterium bohemicum TaxID=56425 RepID=A0A1X1R6R9_MYCBE|nr:GtrA family protein [Mycobacterium bohemicum]MCV6969487.1 GtrA family protein [Mycobacterium bohemicum]ORV00567.1 polysaccharide biosynthesis protein GtrA [Mycobacterium bohemicum]CPR08425.1 GtrA-like protein [Mycobacterium bohemicum DSM 44277]
MTEFDQPAEPAAPGPLIRLFRDQRVAFLIVGVINTVVGFGIFVVCSVTVGHTVDQRFGKLAGTLVTIAISHVLSVLFAFVMHRRFVFRVQGHVLRDLLRFWSVYLTGLGINAVALPLLVELGMQRIPAQAIIVAATTLLSYFGHRHFSFRRSAADVQDERPV